MDELKAGFIGSSVLPLAVICMMGYAYGGVRDLLLWSWVFVSIVYTVVRWTEAILTEFVIILFMGALFGLVASVFFGNGIISYVVPYLAILHEELKKREMEKSERRELFDGLV